jgi:predicted metal-binding membrane protein
MRKLAPLLLVLVASAAVADGVELIVATRFDYPNCSASGSASQTVTGGTYLMRVTDEDVSICYAATCAADGEKFPAGTVMLITFNGNQAVTCRSANATGDVTFTKAR